MDFDVQRCSRRCAVTGRELQPGEWFYSALIPSGASVVRQDYSIEAWQGPPAEALGWWKSQIPTAETKKTQWAPNDVMLELFDELAGQPDRSDLRYVLTLLLIRRRVFRLEETEPPRRTDDRRYWFIARGGKPTTRSPSQCPTACEPSRSSSR